MRKRWVWVILGVGVLAVGVLAVATREREPEYGGRKLSEWVKMYAEGLALPNGSNQAQQASEAIRRIGVEGVPLLAKWSVNQTPGWKLELQHSVNQIIESINSHWTISFRDENNSRSTSANLALMVLDCDTIDAAGGLRKFWIQGANAWLFAAENANYATLVSAGLTNRSQNTLTRMYHAFNVGVMGSNGLAAVPALETLLTEPDLHLRWVATNALRRIRNGTMNTDERRTTP